MDSVCGAAEVDSHMVVHLCGCPQYLVDEQWTLIIFNMLTAYKTSLTPFNPHLPQRNQGQVYFNL